MNLTVKNYLIIITVKIIVNYRRQIIQCLKEEVDNRKRGIKKVLLFVLNILGKCGHRNNSSTVRMYNKSYNSNIEFNYNYNLKYITCKHRRRHLYTNSGCHIILNMSQGILPKYSKDILSEVF